MSDTNQEPTRGLRGRYIRLALLGLVLFVSPEAVPALLQWQFKWAYLGDWAARLGEGAAVAAIIAYFLESYLAREITRLTKSQIDLIKRDVFEGVFGSFIDKDVFATFQKTVLYCPVYREPTKLNLSLTKEVVDLEGRGRVELLRCNWHEEYWIKSLQSPKAHHELVIAIAVNEIPGMSHKCGITEVRVGNQVVRGNPFLGAAGTDGFAEYRRLIEIPFNEPIHIESYSVAYKTLTDAEIFESMMPSKGVELEIRVLGCNLQVRPHIMIPGGFHEGGRHNRDGSLHWVADGPMLPHQGIALQWSPV